MIYTAVSQSYSFGPEYHVADSVRELKLSVERAFSEYLRIDSESGPEASLYFRHDCRVMSDDGQYVIGTDGYPDQLASCDQYGNVHYINA